MKRFFYILIALAFVFSSCEKQPKPNNGGNNNNNQQQGQQGGQTQPDDPDANWTYIYAGNFAYDYMNSYYLWKKEIKAQLEDWAEDVNVDPIAKVKAIRYKDPKDKTKDIDRWTMVTDDYKSFMGDVTGVATTYGYGFDFFQESSGKYYALVLYTYEGSPARAAGLKRGDKIVKIDNEPISAFNYMKFYDSSSCTLELESGETVQMTAIEMVENPVHIYTVLDNGEKKIGYLHYTSFTAESCASLIEACKYFKEEGVKELVLDLRYNGGGAVVAEELLISMLAPQDAVAAGEIFEKEIYNDEMTAELISEYGEDYNVSRFQTQHDFKFDGKQYTFNTADANIGLEKIYAIVTGGSASASEAILCCLKPFYQDNLVLIGQKTYGKYTAGYIFGSDDYFNDVKKYYSTRPNDKNYKEAMEFAEGGLKYASNWGLYVMFARFADRNGKTLCMPDGMPVDYRAVDKPEEGIVLGDPEESILKATLKRTNFTMESSSSSVQGAPERIVFPKKAGFARPEKPGMVKTVTSLPERPRGPWRLHPSNDQYNQAE